MTTNYIKGGNIKLGNIGTISKLMGNESIFIEKLGIEVVGTCGNHCEGCKGSCYVRKSYRYPSVKLSHARTTLACRESIWEYFNSLDNQLSRKRNPFSFVRIHQSGEFETYNELVIYMELAKRHPETVFYTYTKNYDILYRFIETGLKVPSNLFINISIWGDCGINEYHDFKAYSSQFGAFVCITEEYTIEFYASRGIIIESWCKAYNESGKLNHNITCDKCKKCMQGKVVACFEH